MDVCTTFECVSDFFENNKDMLTIGVAVCGGGLALLRYWRDQSWRKKQFAYDYAQNVFGDRKTMTALRMIDWSNGDIPKDIAKDYGLKEADREWTRAEVAKALRAHDAPVDPADPAKGKFSRKEYVIRELFDACLAHFERLGHFMKSRVISAEDFPTTLAYYPQIMTDPRLQELRQPLRDYMTKYKFDYAGYVFDALGSDVAAGAVGPGDMTIGDDKG